MNFYTYDLNLFKKMKTLFDHGTNEFLKEKNATIHLNYSHDCNLFMKNIFDLKCNDQCQYDFFIVPFVIRINPKTKDDLNYKIFNKLIKNLEFFEKNPEKHVFFFVGDEWKIPSIFKKSILFMQSCHKGTNAFPLHFTSKIIENLKFSKPIKLANYDISFQGNVKAHKCRRDILSYLNNSDLKKSFVKTPSLPKYPLVHDSSLIESYFKSIDDSRFVLCPRGVGLNSIRFYETIAAGRIPVLISDHCKLPKFIDWSRLIIRVPEKNISNIENMIKLFMFQNDLEKISLKLKKIWVDIFENFQNFLIMNFQNLFKKNHQSCISLL